MVFELSFATKQTDLNKMVLIKMGQTICNLSPTLPNKSAIWRNMLILGANISFRKFAHQRADLDQFANAEPDATVGNN